MKKATSWTIIVFSTLVTATSCVAILDAPVEVNWDNYHPNVKVRLDALVATKDCQGLQAQFDAAERNSDAQRLRTGEGNYNLMAYTDEQMRKIGCY